MNWEETFLLFLQEHVRSDFLTPIMQFFSFIGNGGWIFILLCIILLIYKPTRLVGIVASVALVLNAVICNLVLKILINRTRPFVMIEDLTLITKLPKDSSFPSGHSSAAFAVACAITLCLPKKKKWVGVLLIVVATIVAFSRLYVGAHYPTDVIAGIMLGIFAGTVSYLIFRNKLI